MTTTAAARADHDPADKEERRYRRLLSRKERLGDLSGQAACYIRLGDIFRDAHQIAEWVASATVVDPLTVVIKLNKPGPRWVKDFLATGQSTRFVTVPKHIWDGQDPKTFANFDLA